MRDSAKNYMRKSFKSTLRSLCECELTKENLFNISMSCDPTSSIMTFNMTLAFSNQEGTVLASDLIQEAEQWVVGERVINSTTFLITSSLDNMDTDVSYY